MDKTYVPCESCGAVNRISRVPVGKAPVCGKCKTELAYHDGVSEVRARGLNALIEKSAIPVIVDFWAEWCGPCRFFAPVFVRLNTESAPESAQRHGITAIPTIAAFQGGRELNRQMGALPEPAFRQFVDAVIG